MSLDGFTAQDFATFSIDGLTERMEAIQNRIQPKFQEIGNELTDHLQTQLGNEMFLHIAKHARRTVNPPKDTWLAIANNKRGYKKHPHFQFGLFDDHIFIWLAFIYELPNKQEIAKNLLNNIDIIESDVPDDFVISLDHTKKKSTKLVDINLEAALERFRDVKKAEFLIGRHIAANDKRITNGEELVNIAKNTYDILLPFYQRALL
ncbi:YktB family protein [Virgibacillus sp. FSP13]